jgi:hypothetical protein
MSSRSIVLFSSRWPKPAPLEVSDLGRSRQSDN